ncbi:MAG: hypothetical protein ACD_20C00214G0024 [uncultured bacterium]|nr:MAG: hypothetical protein ACD_20C00214G0024 [uncultured bacterium]HBH19167.1 hypothetical protein [Cyanobacteria bacterium UBA9579]
MNRKLVVSSSIIVGLLLSFLVFYLYGVPGLLDPEKYKPLMVRSIKEQTGLNLTSSSLDLTTTPDLGIVVRSNDLNISYPDKQNLASAENITIKIKLLPLLFKKIEIAQLKLIQPEVYIAKQRNGKYKIEELLASLDKGQKQEFEIDINKIDLLIKNYRVNYKNEALNPSKTLSIKGDKLNVFDFNPGKFVGLETKGQILVENTPKINFNVKLLTELPAQNQQTKPKQELNDADPIENLIKYDLRGDLDADLKVKNIDKTPEMLGYVDFKNLKLKIDSEEISKSYGRLEFSKKKIAVNSKIFVDADSFLEVIGDITSLEKGEFDLGVKSSTIDLRRVKKLAYALASITRTKMDNINAVDLSGKMKADFKAVSSSRRNKYNGYLTISNATVSHKDISKTAKNINIKVNFNNDKLNFADSYGYIDDIRFDIAGMIDSKNNADLNINLPRVNLATIHQLLNTSPMFAANKKDLQDIKSLSGYISSKIQLKGRLDKEVNPVIKVGMINPIISHKQLNEPVAVTSGEILVNNNEININNIKTVLSKSPVTISGKVTEISSKNPKLDITAKGQFTAINIDKFLEPDVRKSTKAKGVLPVMASIKGDINNWNLTAQTKMDKSNYIACFAEINTPASQIYNLEATGGPNSLTITNLIVATTSTPVKDENGFYNTSNAGKLVNITGKINNYSSNNPVLSNVRIETPGVLPIKLFEPANTVGKLTASLILNGNSASPDINGKVDIISMVSQPMSLAVDSVNADFTGADAVVSFDNISILDSRLSGRAVLSKKITTPLVIKNLVINSDYINMDKISKKFPSQPSQDVPAIIQSGTFNAQKLVVSNLVSTNVNFDFNINGYGILKINNLRSNTAGGIARGNIEMNMLTTGINGTLTGEGMQVNVLATSAANMPNEIFGIMDGNVVFSTGGVTPEQMTYNAKGNTSFIIRNGKLAKLGSFKHLLKAPDFISTGLSIYQVNNVAELVSRKNTESFDTLQGRAHFGRGILTLEEIKTQGKNLSLYLKGNVNMMNNYSDLVILGRASDDVMRLMSPVRKLHLDNLVNKVPIGQFGMSMLQSGLNYARPTPEYPDQNLIPALSSQSVTETEGLFAVIIKGDPADVKSVKSFKWLK